MSTQRDLVHKFKAAFEEKKFDILDSHLADDMTHQALPSSVGKTMTRAEWRNDSKDILERVNSVKLESTNITEHPLFTVVQAGIALAFPRGDFTQDILLLFSFCKDESGVLKISSIVEYVDSFKVKEWQAKMASLEQPSE